VALVVHHQNSQDHSCHRAPAEKNQKHLIHALPSLLLRLLSLIAQTYGLLEKPAYVTVENPQTVRKFRTTNVKTVTKIIEILRKIIESPWAAHLRKQTHAVRYGDRRPF
jgi:hypothetical protein